MGVVLVGSIVEAHEPNEFHQNRWRLRCRCGGTFHVRTQQIRQHQVSRKELVCVRCRMAPPVPEEAERVTSRDQRCDHGFELSTGLCTQCRPEGIRCVICGEEHPSKRCTATVVGRRRSQHALNPGIAASAEKRKELAKASHRGEGGLG